jgi:hypothetical protein
LSNYSWANFLKGAIASFIVEISAKKNTLQDSISPGPSESMPPQSGTNPFPQPLAPYNQQGDVFQSYLDPDVFNGWFSFNSLLPVEQQGDVTSEQMRSFDDWLSQVGAEAGPLG